MKYNLLILFSSIIFSFIIVEILLRIFNPTLSYQKHSYIFDSELGWIHKPNSSFSNVTPDFNVSSSINSLSLRDSEFLNNKKNILVLGDSMVEARQVNDSEVFTELLEDNFKEYEFLNAGVSGYGTTQQLLLYKRLSKEIKFEFVVLLYSKLNDWLDTSYEYQKYMNLENINKRPFYDKNLEAIFPPINFDQNNSLKMFLKNFRSVNLIYNFFDNINLNLKNKKIEKITKVKKTKIYDYQDDYFLKSWNQNREIIKILNNTILNNGTNLIVFGVPLEPIDLSDNFVSFDSFDEDLYIDSNNFNYSYHSLNDCFRSFLVDKNLKKLHFENDGHWNVLGHLAANKCISSFLEKEYLM